MAGAAPPRSRTAPGAAGRRRGRRRFAVVAARFNEPITKRLVDGALEALARDGVEPDAVDVYWVPGSFELPQAAQLLAASRRYAGVICVGVIIRGETPHFEYVAREAAAGIRQAAQATGVPVTFGVITALDESQALARAGGRVGNRGAEAAVAAVEMAAFVAPRRAAGRRRGGGRRGPA